MKKLLALPYILFLSVFVFFSYLFIDPNFPYLRNLYSDFTFSHRQETSLVYTILVIIFFVFYLVFLKMFKENKLNVKNVKLLIFLTCVILFFSYPAMLSFDIFNYILTAKVAFFYQENPYVIMPIQFVGDPLLAFTHAANKIALYGPVWIFMTGIPHLMGFGNFILTLFSFKLTALVFYVAMSWLIHKITKDFTSVLIFSLNPLIVIETLVSGHNDVAMMFFALFGVFLLSRKRILLAFVFLLLSILIKYSTLFLLPVFIYVGLSQVNKRTVDWQRMHMFSFLLMLAAFFLSPIREEIYPWYAIWFLSFAALIKSKNILYISTALSFSFLLRYIPFMLLGTYAEPTPLIKTLVTAIPVILVGIYFLIKERIWLKKSFR